MKTSLLSGLIVLTLIISGCAQQQNKETYEDIESSNEVVEEQPSTNNGDVIRSTLNNSQQQRSNDTTVIRDERIGVTPTTVAIPAINVEAEIEHVGLLPNGQMNEPSTMEGVAWYEPGAKPGDQGSAVLAGHVDSKTGPAVFFDLGKLKKGDEINVTGADGETLTFIVQEQAVYPREEAPVQKIFGYSFRRQLNLITCTGEFNRDAGTHEERMVVYAVLESDL